MWLPNCGTNVVYLKSYLNHSTTPSLRTKDGFHFISLRKICEGEELTVDYRTYGAMRTCLHLQGTEAAGESDAGADGG